ncbi:amino acid permease, partial [bacterium]|nr:amino acid permease [bacterium]
MPKNYYEILKSKSIPVRFQRTMGLFGAVTLGVGALMGAGVYVLIGIAARTAGPGVWVSYFVCGLLAMFSMLSYQRLSTQVPISGGGYAYAYQGLGGFWGFVTGWHLALGSIFACSLYAIGFSYYATSFLHTPLPPYAAKGIAILLVLSFTALNSGGAKGGDRMQKIFTWGNVAVLLIVVVASLRVANTDHLTPHFPHGPMGVVGTIPIIYISFFGYQLIANNSEEIVNPERNLPLSMVLSLLIAWAIYVGIALVAVTTIPWEQLGHSSAPLALVARKSLGGVGLVLVGVGGSLASAAALNSTLLSQARQIFAMGRDKLMMRLLGELHEQTRTPRAALWFGGIGVCLTIALGEVEFISKIAGFSFLLSRLPVSLALHRYEKDRAAAGVPVGLWRRSVPWIAFVANLALLSTMAVDLTVSIFGLILAAVGLLMFFGYSRAREQRGRTGLNVVLTEKKERGAFPFAGGQRILVPMANPKTLDWLFKSSHALFKKRGGEVVLLSIVTATEQVDFHTALANTPSSAVVNLEHAAELAAASKVPFRPVVRVSRDLASGIVHAAEEEHCELVIMGY